MKQLVPFMTLAGLCTVLASCASIPQPTNIAGAWQIEPTNMTLNSNGWRDRTWRIKPVCVFQQNGQSLTGSCPSLGSGIASGTVDGRTVSFVWNHPHTDGGNSTLRFIAMLESDHRMIGQVIVNNIGQWSFTAEKQRDVAATSSIDPGLDAAR